VFEARTLSTQAASREGDVTLSMIPSDDALPFNERTAERLMKIAGHPVLTNTSHLPTSWTTLYELSKASPTVVDTHYVYSPR
jgi:hypothetical protein